MSNSVAIVLSGLRIYVSHSRVSADLLVQELESESPFYVRDGKLCEAWQKVLYCASSFVKFLRDCLTNETSTGLFNSLAILDRKEEALSRSLQNYRENYATFDYPKKNLFFKTDALLASANCLMDLGLAERLEDSDLCGLWRRAAALCCTVNSTLKPYVNYKNEFEFGRNNPLFADNASSNTPNKPLMPSRRERIIVQENA